VLQDIDIIDIIERMRAHLLEECPGLAARAEKMGAVDHRARGDAFFKVRLAALVSGIDDATPEGRRRLRRLVTRGELSAHFNPADLAEGNIAEEADLYRMVPGKKRAQLAECIAEAFSAAPAGGRETTFAGDLRAARNIPEAMRVVRRRLPVLGPLQSYEFLSDIGYPAAVPAAETRKLLFRLGMLPSTDSGARGGQAFQEQVARISHLGAMPVREVDFWLGLFSGGRRDEGVTPVCGAQPRCGLCCIRIHCQQFRYTGVPALPESHPIRNWSVADRPRERYQRGETLRDADLLAIVLRTGCGGVSAVSLAQKLLGCFGGSLHRLHMASIGEIVDTAKAAGIKGIGPAKATEIRAALELGVRATRPETDERTGMPQVSTCKDVFDLYRGKFKDATQEMFLLLALNTKNRVTREVTVSMGTLNSSIVHPRDVFKHALREAAAAVIFVHNHPSGDPAPSAEDRALTRRLVEAGKLLNIRVLDHVIVGARHAYSFAEQGELD
jgi:DNA repair protein RadC